MSDGSLSQDEIDALLMGSTSGGSPESGGGDDIPPAEKDALAGIIQETIESQRSNLSAIMQKSIELKMTSVEVAEREALLSKLPDEAVEVSLNFTEGLSGDHMFLLDNAAAVTIAGPMIGQENVEMNEVAVNALQEAFNTMAGSLITTLGDKTGSAVLLGAPEGQHVPKAMLRVPDGQFAAVTYELTVEGQEPVAVIELFSKEIVNETAKALGVSGAPAQQQQAQQLMGGGQPQQAMAQPQGGAQQPQQGMSQQQMPVGGTYPGGGPNVQSVQFPGFDQQAAGGDSSNISLLMDVSMELAVELGRTKKLIKEILGMGEGTIITLDKLAGEPVDILVNHKLIAKGEVVVIEENFGVRVTEIVQPQDRITGM